MDATVVSNSYLDTLEYQYIVSAINNTKVSIAMQKSNIKPEVLNKIYSNVEIKREYLDKEKKSVDEMTTIIMTTVFPVVILPFFMLSIFLIQSIGSEINDEKTTKGMEIIISNVSYRVHFASKVIANAKVEFSSAASIAAIKSFPSCSVYGYGKPSRRLSKIFLLERAVAKSFASASSHFLI